MIDLPKLKSYFTNLDSFENPGEFRNLSYQNWGPFKTPVRSRFNLTRRDAGEKVRTKSGGKNQIPREIPPTTLINGRKQMGNWGEKTLLTLVGAHLAGNMKVVY